jgi:Flp pilus assembly protein TadD
LVWVAAVGVPAFAHDPPAPAETTSALERGRELLAAGRLWPAEQAAREAIAQQPGSASAHQLLGRVLERRGRKEQALAEFERAWAIDPGLPGLARDLGTARFERGDCSGALEPLALAAREHPGEAVLELRLGLCEVEAGRPDAAALHFEQAVDDPVLGQLAVYNLGLAQLRAGRTREARRTLARAVDMDPESVTGRAAAAAIADPATAVPEHARRWRLALGAGLGYDDNVVVEELDVDSQQSDSAALVEASVGAEWPLSDWDFDLGYDFSDTRYSDNGDLDLQSHGLLTIFSRDLRTADTSLSYAYSYNTLGGSSFLHFHQVRGSFGRKAGKRWYFSPNLSYSVKRFSQTANSDRDADQQSIGLLQLVALGSWNHYLTLNANVEREETDGRRYTYWGPTVSVGVRSALPIAGFDDPPILDARYRFRWRDYRYPDPEVGGQREDKVHELRLRLDVPLPHHLSVRTEYVFKDSSSNLPSADYESNRVDVLLRFELK